MPALRWPSRPSSALPTALWLLLWLLAAALGAIGAAVWAAIDIRPSLPAAPAWALSELSRVKATIGEELRRGTHQERVLTLTQRDLEILSAQAARGFGAPRVAVELDTGRARLRASVALPNVLPGVLPATWLNVDAWLNDTYGMPGVDSLRVGSVPIPGWLAEAFTRKALRQLFAEPEIATQIVQRTSFVRGQVKLMLDWRDDSARRIAASLIGAAELARWRAYVDALATLTRARPAMSAMPMVELIGPLFSVAQRRSASDTAAAENRAALLVLTLYATRRSLAAFVPQVRGWPEPRPLSLTLNGRTDTPLHFLISAALAAKAGGPLADTAGLYKEASDAQGGSGFSFNDLAADRAGRRFGLLAVQSAQRLQGLLAGKVADRDLLPDLDDLPEGLSASEFARRFDRVGTPAYERVIHDIDARIDRCRIHSAVDSQS